MNKKILGYWLGFGTWRLLLALLVMMSHLWSGMIDGYAAYAVWGFFVLSGYLMTYVLMNKYGFQRDGLKAYAFNRFIRIMPSYYLAAMLGILTILTLGKNVDLTKLNPQFAMPHAQEWLNPISLLPVFTGSNLPVPVSGALSTEIGMYLMMPLFARSRSAAWVGLVLGLVTNCTVGFGVESFSQRYTLSETCVLAFAAGSLASHYRIALSKYSFPALALIAWIANGLVWIRWDAWPWTYGLIFSVILSVWVVVSLDSDQTSAQDRMLGDLSYPVYLFHTAVAAWLIPLFGYGRTFKFFAAAFLITIALSWLIVKFFDRPLSRLKIARTVKAPAESIGSK